MTDEIVFYHNPRSRAQMVHWMLEETGARYRIAPIDFEKGENRTPQFLALNPMGKLPTVVHRGVVVTETAFKGRKVFDDCVARLSARPAARRTAGG